MTSRLLEKFDHFRTDLFEDAAASFDHGDLDLVLRDGLELVAVVDEQLTAQLADGDHERGRVLVPDDVLSRPDKNPDDIEAGFVADIEPTPPVGKWNKFYGHNRRLSCHANSTKLAHTEQMVLLKNPFCAVHISSLLNPKQHS